MNHSIFVLLGLFTFTAVLGAPEKEKERTTVFTESAKAQLISDTLIYPARVSAKIAAAVIAENDASVLKVEVQIGQTVKKRQRLFTLKQSDPGYHFAPMPIYSKVDGIVSSIEVSQGSQVTKNTKLATVTDPSQVRILIEVAAIDANAIQIGNTAELQFNSEKTLHAKVTGISPALDFATGTASCELSVPGKSLRPGMLGRAIFKVQAHRGIELPENAIVYRGNGVFVRVISEGKNHYAPVTLGATRGGRVEILTGLKTEDEVIVRASAYLAEGEEVLVKKEDAT